nr:Os04g0441700 [Ipomoea batatas]
MTKLRKPTASANTISPRTDTAIIGRRSDLIDKRDQHRAKVKPEGVRAVSYGGRESLHAFQWLFIEKFNEAYGGEHFGDSEDDVLRRDPEDGDNFAGFHGGGSPLVLHGGGGDHGERGGEEAEADALQRRDAVGLAGEAAGEGDEEGVVERDEEDEDDVRDGLERCGRDLEGVDQYRCLLHKRRAPEIKVINPTAITAAETPKPTSMPEWVCSQTRSVSATSSPMEKAKYAALKYLESSLDCVGFSWLNWSAPWAIMLGFTHPLPNATKYNATKNISALNPLASSQFPPSKTMLHSPGFSCGR